MHTLIYRDPDIMMNKMKMTSIAMMMIMVSLYMVEVTGGVGLPPEDVGLLRKYYKVHNTCANVELFVRHQVKLFWNRDKTITPKLFKLLYSDCMVNGCDASILLDGPGTEKTSPKNAGLGGFELIDRIKKVLEIRCPNAVSCADILNLAARDAANLTGSPSYPVLLGRRDGFKSDATWVDLPSPSISWQTALSFFKSKGLNVQDLGTLLGAHTMGRTHCNYVRDRLYNFNNTRKPDRSMEKSTLSYLRNICGPSSKLLKDGQSDNPQVYLDQDNGPNYIFTNSYYKRVLAHKSVLGVDQQLRYGRDTYALAQEYAAGFEDFRKQFAFSITRMGGLKVLTGNQGEIRKNCRVPNKKYA